MMANRRDVVALMAAGLSATRAGAQPRPSGDPVAGKIVINTQGGFTDYNEKRPKGRSDQIPVPNRRTIDDAHASGVTAINVTLGYVSGPSDPFENTVDEIAAVDEIIRANAKDLLKVYTAADILRAKAEKKIGLTMCVQNCAMLGTKAERVDTFTDLGVRVFQLTYNFENGLGGGSASETIGLKPFGREVIARLNGRRMIVDLSHSGRQTCLDAGQASKQPICITHTGCRALRDIPRNKSDEELRLVGSKGGFVGIFTGGMFLLTGRESTAEDVVRHIEHAINVCGEDHVGIGTDNPITGIDDLAGRKAGWKAAALARAKSGAGAAGEADGLPFTDELLGPDQFRVFARVMAKRGHSQARVDKVLGLNWLRYARETWGA